MRFVITAGPTREYLDDVRFISNASSGRMGYAIARAAVAAGHTVDLVTGPVHLKPPPGVRLISIVSTRDMYQAVRDCFARADCLIGAAAPADYRPVHRRRGKAKKNVGKTVLELKPTIDILATLGKRKGRRILIAFALEVQNPLAHAFEKMRRKQADAIVLNDPSAFGTTRSNATLLLPTGEQMDLTHATKRRIGKALVSLAERLYAERSVR